MMPCDPLTERRQACSLTARHCAQAFIHISDDKTHDSHAAQTFLRKTFDYLEEHYVKTGKENFIAWHYHSDNAPSHFKSSKTMYFLTSLPSRLASWTAHLPISFRVF